MMFSLEGKAALVTGANTGLGQGISLALAGAGADIVGVSRSDLSETKKKIEALGRKFFAITADLADSAAPKMIMQKAGSVDILVNNAGTIIREDAVNCSEEAWDTVLDVNLKSAFFLSQEMAKQLFARNAKGKIINIASMLSYSGGIRVPAYTASKSGIVGITKALANEWAAKGINVNAIAPGYMITNNTKDLYNDAQRSQQILQRIPAGRWGTPEDLGGTAVFLASQASDYLHGFTIAVDGGWLAR